MHEVSFIGDDNRELLIMQRVMYDDVRLSWDIFNGAKAILICSCKVVDTPEAVRLLEYAETVQNYDHRIFQGVIGIIAAMYRYKYGNAQLEMQFEDDDSEDIKEYYFKQSSYQYYFGIKEPEVWSHFPRFEKFFQSTTKELLRYSSFVKHVNWNTIHRNRSKRSGLTDELITNEVLRIYNLTLNESLIDFSEMKLLWEDHFWKDSPNSWREMSHPYLEDFNPKNLFKS